MTAVVRPYMSKLELGTTLNFSKPTINKLVDGLRKEISEGRYPQYAIAGKRISLYAVIDYLTYQDELKDYCLRKRVPDFDPIPIARMCGQEELL